MLPFGNGAGVGVLIYEIGFQKDKSDEKMIGVKSFLIEMKMFLDFVWKAEIIYFNKKAILVA